MTSRPAERSEASASSGDARHVGDRVRSVEAAAIAGIAYAVLSFAARAILAAVPDIDDPGLIEWLSDGGNQDLLLLALNLTSVSTVAFLWFIAVIRRRVGDREDQFFSTVFVGSGIVLIASTLLATAAAVTPAIGMRLLGAEELDAAEVSVARSLGAAVALIVAPRMQAVFVFATSTVVLRSRALPRWLAWVGYGLGVVLFVVPFLTDPIGVVFPVWVMLVSVVILASRTRELGDDDDAESATRLLGGR
jgi:hypothetical protein